MTLTDTHTATLTIYPWNDAIVDHDGHITGVVPRARYDSHKLIEEFMIAANVAAAETLAASSYPAVYRVHEPPDPERVFALRENLQTLDIKLPHGASLKPADFNRVLSTVRAPFSPPMMRFASGVWNASRMVSEIALAIGSGVFGGAMLANQVVAMKSGSSCALRSNFKNS